MNIQARINMSMLAVAVLSAGLWAVNPPARAQTSALSIDCGKAKIGATAVCEPISPALKNETAATLRLRADIVQTGSDFHIVDEGCSAGIGPGQSCAVVVNFTPAAAGERTATLTLDQLAPGDKPTPIRRIALKGQGTAADIDLSTTSIQFGSQALKAASEPQGLTLTRTAGSADSPINIKKVQAYGDFLVTGPTFPQAISNGKPLVLSVRFRPEESGFRSGVLQIVTDADPETMYVLLGGSGTNNTCLSWSSCAFWLCCERAEVWLVLALSVIYWLAMVFERWHRIARPTRELLKAQLNYLQNELQSLPKDAQGKADVRVEKLIGLLEDARALIDESKQPRHVRLGSFLFWSRGQEITGWGYVHEVEVQMCVLLDRSTVSARLVTAEQRLRAAKDDVSKALADKIVQATAATTDGAQPDLQILRALLAEALNFNYNRSDCEFTSLVSWQNKTSYLVAQGLALICVLTVAISGHSILLLMGAAGGLLSRLSRTLQRNDVPTDYGASWTTLFLSPIAGALGAWAGIVLMGLAVKLQVVGSVLEVNWDHPATSTTTLAIALMFGFSERLFDSILDALEQKTLANKADKAGSASTGGASIGGTNTGAGALKSQMSTTSLADATVGQTYSAKLTATGVSAAALWSLDEGSTLPAGLALATNGTVAGTPMPIPDLAPEGRRITFFADASEPPAKVTTQFSITLKPAR